MTTNISGSMSPYHLAFNALDNATQQRIFAEMSQRGEHDLIRRMNQEAVASVRARLAAHREARRDSCCA